METGPANTAYPMRAWTRVPQGALVSLFLIVSPARTETSAGSPTLVQGQETAPPSASPQGLPSSQNASPEVRTNCRAFISSGETYPQAINATLVSVRIIADGELREPTLYKSSGDTDLDKAVLACADGFHLSPMLVAGKPTEVSWVMAHNFVTGFGPAPAPRSNEACKSSHYRRRPIFIPAEATTIVSYHIGIDGAVKNVAVTQSSGISELDQAATECMSSWRFYPATQNGQPVEMDKVQQVRWGRR